MKKPSQLVEEMCAALNLTQKQEMAILEWLTINKSTIVTFEDIHGMMDSFSAMNKVAKG